MAQTEHINVHRDVDLNPAKSKFNPAPCFRNSPSPFSRWQLDGNAQAGSDRADGQALEVSLFLFRDGEKFAWEGVENADVSWKVHRRTFWATPETERKK
jgi:hypothetical protein